MDASSPKAECDKEDEQFLQEIFSKFYKHLELYTYRREL